MKANKVLKMLRCSRPTLCKYVKTGQIKANRLPSGMLDYDEESVLQFIGKTPQERKTVIYARVSTQKQKKDLQNQIETIRNYANINGFQVEKVYQDIASGISYDRGEFQTLVNDIINYKVKNVIISNKDRLTRVSFNMWKQLFENFSCQLIVVNNDDTSNENDEKEIFNDIINMLHCFAMKMYSSRRKKKLSLVKEDLENEISI